MRGAMRGMFAKSTQAIGSRYVGRAGTTRRTTAKLPSSKQPTNKITGYGLIQRAVGNWLPRKTKHEVDVQAKKPSQSGKTQEERFLLRAVKDRRNLKETEIYKASKGLYQLAERDEDIKLKYVPGASTVTGKAEKLSGKIKDEFVPEAPPKIDTRTPVLEAIRANAHERFSAHGGYTRPAPLQNIQEPTDLSKAMPTSSASGWSKQKDPKSGAASGSPSVPHSSMAALVYGETKKKKKDPREELAPKIIVGSEAPDTPALRRLTFTGGSRLSVPQNPPDSPFDINPASAPTKRADNVPAATTVDDHVTVPTAADESPVSPVATETPPPPPPPTESTPDKPSSSSIGEGLPI